MTHSHSRDRNTLNIPDTFFHDEVREGFFVPGKMKHAWAAKMKMLLHIGEILDRHSLTWWVDYGTLLGAVRHKGFIPWDDDIDISMPRPDYEKALIVLKQELSEQYTVIRIEQDPPVPWGYVCNRKKIDLGMGDPEQTRITEDFFGCPYICGMDIFPLDYVPQDPEEREIYYQLLHVVNATAYYYDKFKAEGSLQEWIEQVEAGTGQTIRAEDGQLALYELLDKLSQIYPKDESCGMVLISDWVGRGKAYRSLDWYDRSVRLPFEMIEVPVPAMYERVLEAEYGDWRTPIQGASDHDYPFYVKQDEQIRLAGETGAQ